MTNEAAIVLRDGEGQTLEVACLTHPEQYDSKSASHRMAAWLGRNWEALTDMAQQGVIFEKREKPEQPAVIDGERERTIILPE